MFDLLIFQSTSASVCDFYKSLIIYVYKHKHTLSTIMQCSDDLATLATNEYLYICKIHFTKMYKIFLKCKF